MDTHLKDGWTAYYGHEVYPPLNSNLRTSPLPASATLGADDCKAGCVAEIGCRAVEFDPNSKSCSLHYFGVLDLPDPNHQFTVSVFFSDYYQRHCE